MNDTILIKGGRILDPASGIDMVGDVLLAGGKVEQISRTISASAAEVVEAEGMLVCPGLIDIHVHLREPGNEGAETVATGSAAAVAGGFTSVACMPNTNPALDNETAVEFVYRQADRAGLCNVYPIGAVTKGRGGEELAEIGQMVRAGAVGFSDDGSGITSTGVMFRALQYVRMFDKPILQHCEDPAMVGGGVMNGGKAAVRLGLPGMNPIAEELMIQRDLTLVEQTRARYHVCHVSTARSVELVRQAKAAGLPVTCEICPHHLLLTDEECRTYDTNFKMSPPLRTQRDVDACRQGVADGTIDCLVTDHAPHQQQEKDLEFLDAPFGIIGLETALPLYAKALIEPGLVDWMTLIERLTIRPAAVLSLPKGKLAPGVDADVTIIDPNLEWTVDVKQFRSKSRNCPYDGWAVRGRAVTTIVGGRVKYQLEAAAKA